MFPAWDIGVKLPLQVALLYKRAWGLMAPPKSISALTLMTQSPVLEKYGPERLMASLQPVTSTRRKAGREADPLS